MCNCNNSYDNRETCITPLPSSCIPYVGVINDSTKALIPTTYQCKPNINDVLKSLQDLIDKVNSNLGDNTILDKSCLSFDKKTVKQVDLNQLFITELCNIKQQIITLSSPVDPNTIQIAINLLCLQDPSCTPTTTYSLQTILVKLITSCCNLLDRVKNIENILNI